MRCRRAADAFADASPVLLTLLGSPPLPPFGVVQVQPAEHPALPSGGAGCSIMAGRFGMVGAGGASRCEGTRTGRWCGAGFGVPRCVGSGSGCRGVLAPVRGQPRERLLSAWGGAERLGVCEKGAGRLPFRSFPSPCGAAPVRGPDKATAPAPRVGEGWGARDPSSGAPARGRSRPRGGAARG